MSRTLIAQTTGNRQQHLQRMSGNASMTFDAEEEAPRLSEYWDILVDHKWLIAGVIVLAGFIGLAYAIFAPPVYRSGLLLQVEDALPDSKNALNEASGLFEVKTPATGEIQVLASRMVLGGAVDQTNLQVSAAPRYIPAVGRWLSRHATGLSDPGLFGLGGYVSGKERIQVAHASVPPSLEDTKPFVVTAQGDGRYTVTHELLDAVLEGRVGQRLRASQPDGDIEIELSRLDGKPGAQFTLSVASRLRTVEQLQQQLQLGEQGRQSNVIGVSLEDTDPQRLARVLNAIGDQYVNQNMARRSEEAEKTLAFLDAQLPIFLRRLQASEDAYARFRNKNGTVNFDEEAKVWLKRTSDLQGNLLELEQRKRESEMTFTDRSQRMQILNKQIGALKKDLDSLNTRIAGMPNLQRDALRLERDVRVNSALYQSMQNNALQMRLVKEGKIGNVRLLDRAVVPKFPVKPQKSLILAFALLLGGLLGPGLAVLRARTKSGVRNPTEIEDLTGLDVYAVVPHSPEQLQLDRRGDREGGTALLADSHPHSRPIEALRALRVGLKPAMAEARNNRILITGATPGIGKSFIASNFATLMAQRGKHVLLINADLRKGGALDGVFGLSREGGLSEVLAGTLSAERAIHAGVRPNLDVLTTGRLPDLPADVLESDAFVQTLEMLSPRYDLVVIDSAPVLVAADAAAVAPECGVVLLVARAEQSELGELSESIRRLTQAGAQISGVLFNDMNVHHRYKGSQSYRVGSYRHDEQDLARAG
ncbi:polysaccharide biosynthesis tyrosine autokinase [Variovorax dokdonensis]|uniref:Polysaccharide biosynthesis tyrosine autokinase n=1 Tax=Variovorax dokdonensis TaxID=344883 RepID=A0ABT7N605_9BURK|nr:polysaccharide biosynthesis tyrosine autokinase [Variovorax dokdonensis]MDM0043337.1 polysaccharide biosynthesis tyrosine autokinase [Variovorax dokdonensis]